MIILRFKKNMSFKNFASPRPELVKTSFDLSLGEVNMLTQCKALSKINIIKT